MADSDNDGLIDGREIALGLDALNPDTDADGIFDGEEVVFLRLKFTKGAFILGYFKIEDFLILNSRGSIAQPIWGSRVRCFYSTGA